MKILAPISASIILLFIAQTLSAQVVKKIVVEHFTNTNCSVCGSRNPSFYTNLTSQANFVHLAVHPSAPYSDCKLSLQNSLANDERTKYYGVYGSTPRLVINGAVISSSASYSDSILFTPYKSLLSPATIRIVQKKFAADSIRSSVIIKTEATHSLGSLSLFVALAEDTVFYIGRNGETKHFDVFRKSLTATIGNSFTLPAKVGDSVVLSFSSDINSIWDFNRIYTMAILQETSTKSLVQAEVSNAKDGLGTTAIRSFSQLKASIYPNPSDEIITIRMEDDKESVISLLDMNGKLLRQYHKVIAEININIAALQPAIYFIQIKNDKGSFVQQFIKQ
ncbi:MAG: T9SS type A sorting domain-containing protein [Phycisphaerales bacterium]|nr:T9SS type A sorting domain-containing protein [Phycisphaerales bacterium]